MIATGVSFESGFKHDERGNLVLWFRIKSAQFEFYAEDDEYHFNNYWVNKKEPIEDRLAPLLLEAESADKYQQLYSVDRPNHSYDEYYSHMVVANSAPHAKLLAIFDAPHGDETLDDWLKATAEPVNLLSGIGVINSNYHAG